MAAIPTARSIASTPSPTDRSFSWWTERVRRFFAYAKPPNWVSPIIPAQELLTAASGGIHVFVEL